MKYIFITGGVVSGLGKGICAASLGRLLKQRGLRVRSQKFDPYLNVDPGTMSPYQHGEVFVTDDGAETDLDLGHYERFTDENLTVNSSVTSGKVYWTVLNRERIGLLNPNAIVLNVGRGTAIDTDALSDALYGGKIAGAALDVTDPEPLPEDHPLWDAPRTLITPHISGGYSLPETLEQICGIFAENLERFRKGEPLRNVVDMETGYAFARSAQ